MPVARTILHVDMDAFFAAVEQRDRPELRGRPVLVGGTGRRGVVTTASYEARRFGCRSAMPMAQARRLCPAAVVVPGRMGVYSAVSRQVRAILERYTPDVEPLSIDEAFLDVTGSARLKGDGRSIAESIRREIRAELSLAASVGVAPNKFLAKVASDLAKPDGLRVIEPGRERQALDPLPVGVIFGIGPRAAERLAGAGIRRVADLAALGAEGARARFGEAG
ncbi:MAG: DNA polymerase IV, partial [Phycisphaeraceae bacterium]|nr:DNA polymerase IV [Phycisphaeraceae bacterium]